LKKEREYRIIQIRRRKGRKESEKKKGKRNKEGGIVKGK